MKQPGLFLKITVVSVFLLLLATFVAYRAGAFDGSNNLFSATDLSPADSPVKDSAKVNDIDMMSSSKSGEVFYPDTAKPQQQQQAPVNASSSERKPNQANKPDNSGNNANPPRIMHSSKSGPVFEPKPDTSKPKE